MPFNLHSRAAAPCLLAAALMLSACTSTPNLPSSAHLRDTDVKPAASNIPAPVSVSPNLPPPRSTAKTETYSVVVNNIRAQELLFALARDAKLNVDIHPGIQGSVTLNAIDQTLQQLLQRIAKQIDMRWELDGNNLAVMPDAPFLRTYRVDYVNLTRETTGIIGASSQIATGSSSSGTNTGTASSSGQGAGSNVSSTRVENKVSNRFWVSLEKNIQDLLRETDKILPEGSSETVVERNESQNTTGTGAQNSGSRNTRTTATNSLAGSPNAASMQQDENTTIRRSTFREAASVIVNAETGIVTVRATARQHEKVQEFIDQVTASARRQVMIEATIVEVALSDSYRQGINWSRVFSGTTRYSVIPAALSTTDRPVAFSLGINDTSNPLSVNSTLSLLEQFGNVKVLSSPRLSVLNNQTALLKVVENFVYFQVKSDVASSTVAGVAPVKAFTTTPQSVSVGLVMAVTPQISASNSITLNVRPSISSISGLVQDPNPDIPTSIGNAVPKIQTREIESVMRVEDGEIAVLGGLMQEKSDFTTGRVPGLGAIPIIGEALTRRDNMVTKSELVIFLRPVVIRDPSVSGDYKSLRNFLPGEKFFDRPAHAAPFGLPNRGETQP